MGRPLIPIFCKPITVEDGVWVAAKAVICPGSVLARMSVVAVGVVWGGTTAAACIPARCGRAPR